MQSASLQTEPAEHPLKAERLRRKLSRAKLGELIGRSRSYVKRLEEGTRQASPDLCEVIKKELGIPPSAMRPDLVETFGTKVLEAAE